MKGRREDVRKLMGLLLARYFQAIMNIPLDFRRGG